MASVNKDEILITALLSSPTKKEAAKKAGIGLTKLKERLNDPAFIEKLDAAKRDLLEQSTVYIQGIVSEAITKMRDIMNDPDAPQQTQLNAAECLLRNCYKLTETSTVLEDIAELKKAVFPDE